MRMRQEAASRVSAKSVWLAAGTLLWATFLMPPANSEPRSTHDDPGPGSVQTSAALRTAMVDGKDSVNRSFAIPPGTILPVRLESTISSAKSRAGQVVKGRIMQEVPLPEGAKIREGSKVLGHIVEVTPTSSGEGARVSLEFDKLISSHETMAMHTDLRAIAGFMRVGEALTPTTGPGESDVYRWLTTVQVGGDVVYGAGGPVTASEDAGLVVGKAVNGGVLVQVRAKPGTKCRGAIEGNESPQALWVFSSDACGIYGLRYLRIEHAGRTQPTGVIVFGSETGDVKIPAGAGMLLRVVRAQQ